MNNVGSALLLTTLAGFATSIGSLLGVFIKKPGPKFMSLTLGFSAGVMLLVSFVELLAGSIQTIGFFAAHVAFFSGIVGILLIDFLIPHEYIGQKELAGKDPNQKLLRTGLLVAVGIGIHNFPEGMATFAAALQDLKLGSAVAIAIAIHNIPEGLAVSAPVYAATGSRGKAFFWSFLSGAAEPVGAGIAGLFLLPFLSSGLLGGLLAIVAGIMVFISLDELVPASRAFGEEHLAILGVLFGMVIMAFSLWLFK
ncbi:MAG: zinc transporter ZupT [Pseudomonadota bacterium]